MKKVLHRSPALVLLLTGVVLNLATAFYGVMRSEQPLNLVLVILIGNLFLMFSLYRLMIKGALSAIEIPEITGNSDQNTPSVKGEPAFRKLVDDFPEAVLLMYEEVPYYVNRSFMQLLELSHEEIDEGNYAFSRLLTLIQRAMDKAGSGSAELGPFRTVTSRSHVLSVELAVFPLGGPGSPLKAAVISDVTGKEEHEKYRREMEEEVRLQARLAALGQVAIGITHSISDPLMGIMGVAEMGRIQHSNVPEFEEILHATKRMASIVNDLAIKGRNEFNNEDTVIDFNVLLTSELQLLKSRFSAVGIETEVSLQKDLPSLKGLYSDFSLAIGSLLLNAIDAMTQSRRRILRVRTHHLSGSVWVEISDTGKGMKKRELERIFEPFYSTKEGQDESGDSPLHLGLGLPTSRYLLSRAGAVMEVLSTPDMGTTIRIRVPIEEENQDESGRSRHQPGGAETQLSGVFVY